MDFLHHSYLWINGKAILKHSAVMALTVSLYSENTLSVLRWARTRK